MFNKKLKEMLKEDYNAVSRYDEKFDELAELIRNDRITDEEIEDRINELITIMDKLYYRHNLLSDLGRAVSDNWVEDFAGLGEET